jgi:hypothetical protein
MTGTDDRSPGSIMDLALSWGMSPENARRIEATAAALLVDAHIADERSSRLHQPCRQQYRRDAQRENDR